MSYSVEMERGADDKASVCYWVVDAAGGRVDGPFASLAEAKAKAEARIEAEALKELKSSDVAADDSLSPG